MKYFTIPPPAQLAPYVRYYWVLEGDVAAGETYIHRSMADGCAELLFHYNGVFDELVNNVHIEKSFSAGLSGPSQKFRRFSIQQSFGIFGVYLYPFAVTQLMGVPAEALSNQMPDLESILGKEACKLEEQMMLAENNSARAKLISTFLLGRLKYAGTSPPGVFETIRQIISTRGTANVSALAAQNFLSLRQFERNFKQFAGFSPKLFSRIIRFQGTLAEYGNKEKSLTQIAYDAGYYDQSHFTQNFKEFSCHNPKEYFTGRAEGTEWK